VKPGNLLVTPDGQVKVTDFGVARAADTAALTMTGHLVGTPHYLSPEQAEGGTATAVSDVYALGIVLFECLTGRKPFVGETPVATAVMQIREPLPPLPAAIPQRLQRITQVATTKDPSSRFRTAGAMAAALRDESPDTRSYLLPEQERLEEVADERERHELLGARRILVALGAVFLVAGAVWAMTASTDDPVATPAAASQTHAKVRVTAAAYVGLPVATAKQRLRDLGLQVGTKPQQNPGGEHPGTVAAVAPTGLVASDTRIVLSVWSKAPAPAPTAGPAGPSAPAGPKPAKHHGPAKKPGKGHGPGPRPGPKHGPKPGPKPGPGHGPGHGPGGKPGKGHKR
jgi:serine/threonine-protein kinase